MRILVQHNGEQQGPYSLEEVRTALQAGSLSPDDLAWEEGTPSWVPLSSLLSGSTAGRPPGVPGAGYGGGYSSATAKTSGLAISSLVLGILSFVCLSILGAIPAIICGHMGRSQIRRSGGALKGNGLAMGGLVLGYLNILLLFVMIPLALPAINEAMKGAQKVSAMNNARVVAQACATYAESHDGTYPNSLEELVPTYVAAEIVKSPLNRSGGSDFDYLQAGKKSPQPTEVLLVGTSKSRDGKQVVCTVGGNVTDEVYSPR